MYPLKLMCRVYDVSREGYYAWKRRGVCERSQQDLSLLARIERVYGEVEGIYGSPKVTEALRQEGLVVGENRVARLMREEGLKARCARIYRHHAGVNKFYASIGNQICTLEATGPDQIWVGDVTYLEVNDEWRYLAMVMDKYSRRIVGWKLSSKRDGHLSLAAFQEAAKGRIVQPGLYFHSDRGAEYVAIRYQSWLKDQGVIQSMNRKGVMNDNAEMESFFHNFKAERIHRNAFTTERELRAVIHEYVAFYNEQRLHSSLGYISPAAYEVKMAS